MAWIEVDLDLESIAQRFSEDLNDSTLIEFVMDIDAYRADLQFTKTLHAKLGRAIEIEESV